MAALALLLSSCGLISNSTDPSVVGVSGVKPTLEQLSIGATYAAQEQFLLALINTAGLPPGTQLNAVDPNWSLIWKAGVYEVGRQCDQYLDALFRFNREQRAGRQGLAAAASAAGAIMGLAGASSEALGITAAAFGLTTGLFDATVNSVLFTIEPSALRNVALQGRENYLAKYQNVAINTRPDTLIALQGYLVQCSPSSIEANINNAASGAPSVASQNGPEARQAAALAAPGSTLLLERAGVMLDQRVQVAPPPIPQTLRPPNLTPAEAALRLTIGDIKTVQRALGVADSGDIGRPGLSVTRKAIEQFQLAMNDRDPHGWPRPANPGELTGKTADWLTTLTPMPAVFLSPFERAFLGNEAGAARFTQVDPAQLDEVLDLLGLSAAAAPELVSVKMQRMHDRIAQIRQSPAAGQALDAELYEKLRTDFNNRGPG